jgi:hypothetical protein
VISFGQLLTEAERGKILLTSGSCHGWPKADHCQLHLVMPLMEIMWRWDGSNLMT